MLSSLYYTHAGSTKILWEKGSRGDVPVSIPQAGNNTIMELSDWEVGWYDQLDVVKIRRAEG